jgi:hypothetical protein
MMICTYYSTDRSDGDFIPAVIEATGDSIDDLIPAISDEVATELAMADEIGKTVEISDQEGNEIERSVFGVADALAKGATCIVLKNTLSTGETYENVFTIHNI